MPRLFVAIELPTALRERMTSLPHELRGAKWVKADQMHLTLRFIGEVAEGERDRIADQLSAVKSERFQVQLSGAGAFPSVKRAHVLWIGIAPSEALARLKGEVDAALAIPDPESDRPFKPHLTLARLTEARPSEVEASLRSLSALDWEPFEAERFVLFSSKLGPGGATHTAVRTYPIG
jgi:RNA 2',3'-cyclic 3'-phosphodiesterase